MRRGIVVSVALLLTFCCLLSAAGGLAYLLWPRAVARPVVLIRSPGYGERVEVGETVTVHSIARDEGKVARVEFWADGELQETQTSSLPGGTSPFPLLAQWQPLSPGTHTLTVRAFNPQGGRAHASVNVEAFEIADPLDADGDGVSEAQDGCPAQPGPPENDGCPVAGDSDADGIPDAEDACPEERGLPENDGCPDFDDDGVRGADDACPDEPGLPEHDGCPDRDGDGIPDRRDFCPDHPGPPESGCPDTGAGDRDGDRMADDVDLDPDDPGLPEHGGAPPPGGGRDADGDGRPDADEPPESPLSLIPFWQFFLRERLTSVEFEALEFEVDQEYDQVYCYASLAGGDMERYGPFDPLDETHWDIAEHLGGENSQIVGVPAGGPLEVWVECGADVMEFGRLGGWGTSWNLGAIETSHDRNDWDGEPIPARSEGGEEGHWFEAQYRICEGSCEEEALQPPILRLWVTARRLSWLWEGDRENITGFKLYVNDAEDATLIPRGDSELFMPSFEPPCGERYEFEMTAYSGDPLRPDRESPRSNTVYWTGPTCPRTVRVTFHSLQTYSLPEDLDDAIRHLRYDRLGPIEGFFYANDQHLPFDYGAVHVWNWEAGRWMDLGWWLKDHEEYNIAEYFRRCRQEPDRWDFECPNVNFVDVELGPYDNLTIGGFVKNIDIEWLGFGGESAYMIYGGWFTLERDQIEPGSHTIQDYRRDIELTVTIDVWGD